MTTEFSIILPICRPGSMDLVARSLSKQIPNYELIVVDSYPGRVERGVARKFLEDKGVNVGWYGKPKEKSYPDTPSNFANAMNTGLLHASARRVIFIHDYTYMPETDVMQQWAASFTENGTKAIISGTASRYNCPPPDLEGDITVWNNPEHKIGSLIENWIPGRWEIFYAGFDMHWFELTNGFDERGDGYIGWPLASIFVQSMLHEYRLVVDRRLDIGMLDHRVWPNKPGGYLWNYTKVFPKDDQEPGWVWWSPNPFDFKASREMVLKSEGRWIS